MNCGRVRKHLSEYIDESLEATTKALVEEHLSVCEDCQKEVASLRMLIDDLGSIESVAPPKDFLDQLHKRMERRSWFSKILDTLSIPMRAKLPMKLAGAVVMAVLVFIIFQVQKDQYGTRMPSSVQEPIQSESSPPRLVKPPLETGVQEEADNTEIAWERVKPKLQTGAQAVAQKDEAIGLPDNAVKRIAHVGKKADHSLQKGCLIELSLVIKGKQQTDIIRAASDVEAPQAQETKMKRRLTMGEPVPATQLERDRSIEHLFPRLREVTERAGGEVVSVEYEEGTNIPESVRVEIPAKQIGIFQNDLQALGELHGTPIGPTEEGEEVLPIRIRLVTP
jgi:hypothetical protein